MITATVGGLFGLLGVVVGWFLSWLTQRSRERREAEDQRRRLASALCAELRALRDRGRELLQEIPVNDSGAVYVPMSRPVFWSAQEHYFAVYDGVGSQLALLSQGLAVKVVTAYVRGKVAVDSIRAACWMSQVLPQQSADALSSAARTTQDAVRLADELIPELEAVASAKATK